MKVLNIVMVIKEMYIDTTNSFDSAQDRNYWSVLVNAALNHKSYNELVSYITFNDHLERLP